MTSAGDNKRGAGTARLVASVAATGALLLAIFGATSPALAAGPPIIVSTAVEGVSATGVTLRAAINPNGLSTTYRFEYLTEAAYLANLKASRDPFTGATVKPSAGGSAGSGTTQVTVSQHPTGLTPNTAYRYRVVAQNSAEKVVGVARPFGTQEGTNVFELLDHRGWEMVSPIDKNGGSISLPGTIFGGGVFQASSGGGSIAYSSADAFGAGAQGAPSGSQYIATRGEGAWSTANITTAVLSGSYGNRPNGVPYQLFAPDLSRGLLSNGERCRGEAGGECKVANPPLPGTGAPSGYRNYYLRSGSGSFTSILTSADLSHTTLTAAQFELRFAAASPDLSHVVLASCAALSNGATETATPGTCEAADRNLYEYSGGSLVPINVLPAGTTTTPGAAIAAPAAAVSADGSRVYWTEGGNLYLREGSVSKQVDESLAGGGEFQTASSDGATAYLTKEGNLYRYAAASGTLSPLVSDGTVTGVLGASANGNVVYYLTSAGLFVRTGSTTTEVAAGADATNAPPATGTARVSSSGSYLVFTSKAELTGYPNETETEVFRYGPLPGGGISTLTCVSCNPTGESPNGPATIPGARTNGNQEGATRVYKPRVLSADGSRVFFDSADALVSQDTNGRTDVYEWEADGSGTCANAGGCIGLVSSGRDPLVSTFVDASENGDDAYFLTNASLFPLDPGSYDIYDARVGGGFTVPSEPIPCVGDACQVLPEAPEDPTPGTLVPNAGNPPLTVAGNGGKSKGKKKHKKHKKKKGKTSKGRRR